MLFSTWLCGRLTDSCIMSILTLHLFYKKSVIFLFQNIFLKLNYIFSQCICSGRICHKNFIYFFFFFLLFFSVLKVVYFLQALIFLSQSTYIIIKNYVFYANKVFFKSSCVLKMYFSSQKFPQMHVWFMIATFFFLMCA